MHGWMSQNETLFYNSSRKLRLSPCHLYLNSPLRERGGNKRCTAEKGMERVGDKVVSGECLGIEGLLRMCFERRREKICARGSERRFKREVVSRHIRTEKRETRRRQIETDRQAERGERETDRARTQERERGLSRWLREREEGGSFREVVSRERRGSNSRAQDSMIVTAYLLTYVAEILFNGGQALAGLWQRSKHVLVQRCNTRNTHVIQSMRHQYVTRHFRCYATSTRHREN